MSEQLLLPSNTETNPADDVVQLPAEASVRAALESEETLNRLQAEKNAANLDRQRAIGEEALRQGL